VTLQYNAAMLESVPLFDLKRQHKALEAELRQAFERVLASGQFILGSEVEAFEAECRASLGARHALAVSSGTDALLLAFMALGIGPGDEVVCPAYTFFATAGCVSRVGATPVFADVLPCCLNLDPRALERALTPRTKAIVPVHLFGQCCDMAAIQEIARRRDVPVVEDAAQSLSARFLGKAAGTMGAIGCYSFFPTKNLGALGDAGLVTSEDDALAERLPILRVHGMKPKYHHHAIGGNFRIDALQAALLRVKLPRLASYTDARRKNAALYRQYFQERGLADEVQRCGSIEGTRPLLLPSACQPGSIWNQFVLRVRGEGKRDALQKHLVARGMGTEVSYPVPLHLQECFRALGGHPGSFPVSEQAARETIALPIFPELLPDELRSVCEAVSAFFGG
jgi:dTDP-4-amino-4,6-dideoxygalactose transaminase